MSGFQDDQAWLRSIGATAVDDNPGDHHVGDGTDFDDRDEPASRSDQRVDGESAARESPPIQQQRSPGEFVDLDVDHPPDDQPGAARRFNPWVAGGFAAVALLATLTTLTATVLSGSDPAPPPPQPTTAPRVGAPAAPPPAPAPPETADGPLPYTAAADCLPGSTAAQSVADPNSPQPWICVRRTEGVVLTIDLGRVYVITAVSILPGAINKTDSADQEDPWLQHRVVTRLQWQFNDTDNTILKHNTGGEAAKRGEAVLAVPHVLASRISVIIQETSRPPAIPPSDTAPAPANPGDSILGPILGTPQQPPLPAQPAPGLPSQPGSADSSDRTFAVSSIKIIGHKAI
ncbi:hypothetical protein PJI20_10150 [Mycobacterium kansasii]